MFSHISRIVAVLALVLGVLQLALGLAIANEWIGPYQEALSRYAPHASSSGQIIDRAMYQLGFAVVLGTLAEIGLAVRRLVRPA